MFFLLRRTGVAVESRCLLKMSSPYFAVKDCSGNIGVTLKTKEHRSISALKSKMARSANKPQNSDSVVIKEEKEEQELTPDNNLVTKRSRAGNVKLAVQSFANVTAQHP